MTTTNVKPDDLNYDRYSDEKYDADIVNSIPFYKEIHDRIIEYVKNNLDPNKAYSVLDLGVGTAITSKLIKDILPKATFDVVDFSEQMMEGAKRKLGEQGVRYLLDDYASMEFDKKYDIIVSVIGLHHQNSDGKKAVFKKVYELLNTNGVFIFGDLVTHEDPRKAAINNAKHFHHLVEKASDEKTLEEWAHHHQFLNDLAPVEHQLEWLKEIGFEVKQDFLQFNTVLLFCKKGR